MALATRLTDKGRAKLAEVRNAVRVGVYETARQIAVRMLAAAAATAPSEAEEAELLSEGVTAGGRSVGVPDGDRFIRQGGNISAREAILAEPVVPQWSDQVVAVPLANSARLNLLTGFSWMRRNRALGLQGPTYPYQFRYMEALEFGGVWFVVPRSGTLALEPQPGVFTQAMMKTIQPYGPFSAGIEAGAAASLEIANTVIRGTVRRVGRD